MLFIMDFKTIREKIYKQVDDDLKGMYNGTFTTVEESKPFTMADLEMAKRILDNMPPPPPDFVFSPHIGDDDAYESNAMPFFKNGVVFVGKNVRDELEKQGLPVIHFKRRNENDDEKIGKEKSHVISD
jgi:hypothetical protein